MGKLPQPHSSPEVAASPAVPEKALAPLPSGAEVEVRVDDDGFHGSWFEATVVDFSPARGRDRRFAARYKVTYSHLLADDGGVLAEHFAVSHTRPRPPKPPTPPSFSLHDIVEAFHNDGWWSGIVAADPTDTITVAFPITREVIKFPPRLVRPRRDYVAGEWVPSRAVIAVQPKRAVWAYEVGDKVEVERDREVYGLSWFPATVTKVVDPLSYIVEYFDQEEDATEKDTEYLHWRFIRPAVEHEPLASEFQLGPGAAVEAYCDGAWSPGIVRSELGNDEYEVSIDGKKGELLVSRGAELLKPHYKWNGKKWKIVSAKRPAYLRRQSLSGRSPSSPVDVASSEDEHGHDHGSSAVKRTSCSTNRPRNEPQQNELMLTEGNNNLEVLPDNIGQIVASQEILSEVLPNIQLTTPTCGTGALIASADCNVDSTLAKQRQANLKRRSISERSPSAPFGVPFSADGQNHDCGSSGTKKLTSRKRQRKEPQQQDLIINEGGTVDFPISEMDIPLSTLCKSPERGHSLCELLGKHDASDNSQLTEDGNLCPKEIICALAASVDCRAKYKMSANKKSKELSNPHNLINVDNTFHNSGRGNPMGSMKYCTQPRSTYDAYQEQSPLIPPGFESIYNANGISRHGNLLDEELTNDNCQANGIGSVSTDGAAIQGATQQGAESHQNAGSSSSTVENSKLRRCSVLSQLTSPISGNHVVPFVKTSPLWRALEASDAFKLLPQQPQFLTSQDLPLEVCEGLAFGLMVTFTSLVESIKKARIEESMDFFKSKFRTLHHLEINGFNVQFLRKKLTEMLEIKSNFSEYVGEISKLKTEVVEKINTLSRMDALFHEKDEAIGELERRLAHLREEANQIAKNREGENAELLRLQSDISRFEEACAKEERKFRNLLCGPHQKRLS